MWCRTSQVSFSQISTFCFCSISNTDVGYVDCAYAFFKDSIQRDFRFWDYRITWKSTTSWRRHHSWTAQFRPRVLKNDISYEENTQNELAIIDFKTLLGKNGQHCYYSISGGFAFHAKPKSWTCVRRSPPLVFFFQYLKHTTKWTSTVVLDVPSL